MRFVLAIIILVAFMNEAAPAQEQIKPVIRMHSSDDCGPCRTWWLKSREAWERLGWRVERVLELQSVRPIPWFDIRDSDGVRFQVEGPLNRDNFLAARKAKLATRKSFLE